MWLMIGVVVENNAVDGISQKQLNISELCSTNLYIVELHRM